MNQIEKYTLALTNLYGKVAIDQIIEIYNDQNPDKIENEELVGYFQDHLHPVDFDGEHFCLMGYKRDVEEELPYYVPDKQELLKYANIERIEYPVQVIALHEFLLFELGVGSIDANQICFNVMKKINEQINDQIHIASIYDEFRQVPVMDPGQVRKFVSLIEDIANNIRQTTLNGFTSSELHQLYGMDVLISLM